MKKEHMAHDVYTVFVLRNVSEMFRNHADNDARLYAVALNVITLLATEKAITQYEVGTLGDTFAEMARKSTHVKPI